MNYLYYPGCSLEGTAKEYDISTRALMQALEVDLADITDWSCCGSSAAESVSQLLCLALSARNLALAEKMDQKGDILVPCSACYLNLQKVSQKVAEDAQLLTDINTILKEDNLTLKGDVKVRHLLDVLATDVGATAIAAKVQKPLKGLRIAPYYGCQCLRPYALFDDPEAPQSMEPLIEASGASVWSWTMGAKCCGANHMNTKPEVGIELVAAILRAAKGADAIVTVCPMCQMNLDAFQKKISAKFDEDLNISVLYLPQLLGRALGLSDAQVRLDLNFSPRLDFGPDPAGPDAESQNGSEGRRAAG